MKPILLHLTVAVLTFCIGTAASMVRTLSVTDTPEALLASQHGWFEPLRIINGMDACGPDANYHTYELSDGAHISNSCERLASPAAADRALQNTLAHVTEIIERRPNLDDNGRRVGEIVIAKAGGIIKIHTYESFFCSTEAPSLKHLQWYEHH
jgi:hypothetical protein